MQRIPSKRLMQQYLSMCMTSVGEGNGSSVLAWRIPGTGEPAGLPSVGLQSWTQLK